MLRETTPKRQDVITVAAATVVARDRPYPVRQRILSGEWPRYRCAGRTLLSLRDVSPIVAQGRGGRP